MTDLDVQTTLRRIQADIDNLTELIKGDGSAFKPGIMGVLDRTATVTEANAQFIAKLRWTIAGASSIGAVFGGGVVAVLSQLIGE